MSERGAACVPAIYPALGRAFACGLVFVRLLAHTAAVGAADPPGHGAHRDSVAAASSAVDLDGHMVDPFGPSRGRAIVLVFIANDCPISNRYAPEIKRLYATFKPRGVSFWLVHPDADESVESIRRHATAYRYSMNILRDPRQVLVRRAQAHVTPEVAVFLPNGQRVYHGRIDNRYADFGRDRAEATQHDLEEALNAVLEGRPVSVASTRAVGCYIPDAK